MTGRGLLERRVLYAGALAVASCGVSLNLMRRSGAESVANGGGSVMNPVSIRFRTDDETFKNAMEIFTQKMVDLMKSENMFASQGGPIVLSQIENECNRTKWLFASSKVIHIYVDNKTKWLFAKRFLHPDILDTLVVASFVCYNVSKFRKKARKIEGKES
ncbi:hypothetical protein CASFOL_018385 [Castilleja foliolosa]|uniref:beta-galactosidase n=1 Tax=Castilleja foliolosa TaxID=1961234 RepID=A0ABD3DAZ8_9LAMI